MKEELKRLIQQNKLSQVFDKLNEMILDDDDQNTSLLLYSRYSRLQKQTNAGVISSQDESMEYNRIVSSVLYLISNLKESDLKIPVKNAPIRDLSIEEIISKTLLYSTTFLKNKQPFSRDSNIEMKLLWEKIVKPLFLDVIKDKSIVLGLEQNPNDTRLQAKFEIRLEDALSDKGDLSKDLQEQIHKIEHSSKTEQIRIQNKTTVSGNNNMIIQGVNESNIIINYPNNR